MAALGLYTRSYEDVIITQYMLANSKLGNVHIHDLSIYILDFGTDMVFGKLIYIYIGTQSNSHIIILQIHIILIHWKPI